MAPCKFQLGNLLSHQECKCLAKHGGAGEIARKYAASSAYMGKLISLWESVYAREGKVCKICTFLVRI